MSPRSVAVVGAGLIGGSVARAAAEIGAQVTVADPDPAVRDKVAAAGIAAAVGADPREAVAGADLVVVAAPVPEVPAVLEAVAGACRADAAVTDVGSAKAEIVAAGQAALGGSFVGGHPMAGSERHGFGAARADLFRDASWVLTPTEATAVEAYAAVRRFVTSLGARPVALHPDVHDEIVARLSHLPQLAAAALVSVALDGAQEQEALLALAAGGFRDATRVAASRPDLWVGIVRFNRQAVVDALAQLGHEVDGLRRLVERERWDDLAGYLERARAARLERFAKPVAAGPPVALELVIPDRPGVLAQVTTAAGRLGVNIEDLRIVHAPELHRGRLDLVVSGDAAADALQAALEGLGYEVSVGEPW